MGHVKLVWLWMGAWVVDEMVVYNSKFQIG